MDLLVDRFLNYIRIEKGLADNSINAYARDIRGFAVIQCASLDL